MYQRILVPVDGSATSMAGLKHAIGLAKDQRALLRVLNVLDDLIIAPLMMEPGGSDDFTAVIDALRAEGQDILNKASALAEQEGVKVETVQIENRGLPVSDAILKEVERSSCDLIVMGTHGRRGLNRILLGSDAERVLRESPVPVLLTRAQETTVAEKSPVRQAA